MRGLFIRETTMGHAQPNLPETEAETLAAQLPPAVEAMASRLLERTSALSLTLATAESCTGGLISSILTDIEGKSHAFECGFTVYSDDAKVAMLGVDRQVLAREGAVSKAVALEMAQGALERCKADVVLAVSGFAGRGKPGDEPGLVHFACMRRDKGQQHHEAHFGDIGRTGVRIAATERALRMMADVVGWD